jgi:hypothetical protein
MQSVIFRTQYDTESGSSPTLPGSTMRSATIPRPTRVDHILVDASREFYG